MRHPQVALRPAAGAWLGLLLAAVTVPVHAGDDAEDWPCVQGLVHEISPSVIWAGPPVEDHLQTWYADAGVSRTVEALIDRRATAQERGATLDDWLQPVPPQQREARLTAVFTGVWSRLNSRRKDYIDGILRYAREQKATSDKLEAYLNEIAELQDNTDEDSIRRLVEVEETVKWQERIFDQRESGISRLCEQPVRVEEDLGDIARMIAERLE